MSRTHVTVIVPPELADGYRLAGVRTEPAGSAADAAGILGRLLADPGAGGVTAVHAAYLRELGEGWQRRIGQAGHLLVVALPEGEPGGAPPGAAESLRDLLARAVGYEFTFDPMEGPR